jgi:hypothetical protein
MPSLLPQGRVPILDIDGAAARSPLSCDDGGADESLYVDASLLYRWESSSPPTARGACIFFVQDFFRFPFDGVFRRLHNRDAPADP